MIRILSYQEIDPRKWNRCIQHASNRLIYAEYEFLSHMAGDFEAIVSGDYEAVMPLTWRKKYGIRYLYQPAFCQQGGVFGNEKITNKILPSFLEEAIKAFRFAEITLNFQNLLFTKQRDMKIAIKNNFLLHLYGNYESISSSYGSYLQQRLKRAQRKEMKYLSTNDFKKVIRIYKILYGKKMVNIVTKDYSNLESLCEYYHSEKRVIVREVWDREQKQMLASILLLKDTGRIYNLASAVTDEGKKSLANYFLLDAVIREFAGQSMILDFEGSNIPGVAYFYEKWADENQTYPFVKWNRLPGALKLIKK